MTLETFAERVIAFNSSLRFEGALPEGIRIMNPFVENESALEASSAFYRKFYNDNRPRRRLIGINPGRFGAGLTGVPFTDPKRLLERCGINSYKGPTAHEPSSVFVYEAIAQYGGEKAFYGDFYINSICPLGFTKQGENGKEVNFNYYDRKDLFASVREFMVTNIRRQIDLGLLTDAAFCLGMGRNFDCVSRLNTECGFFKRIVPLEHPRYVIQYKSWQMGQYVEKYLEALRLRGEAPPV